MPPVRSCNACATSPPFAHTHSHMTLLPTIPCSRMPMFIPRFTTFAHLLSHTHGADAHLWVCTRQAWAHVQPNLSHYLSFETFLAFSHIHSGICMLVRTHWFTHMRHGLAFNPTRHTAALSKFSCNILQSHSQCMADVTAHVRLNMKTHHPFSLSLPGSCHNTDVITSA
jgi:hypothetical protein